MLIKSAFKESLITRASSSLQPFSSHQSSHSYRDLFFDPDPTIPLWKRIAGGVFLPIAGLSLVTGCSSTSGGGGNIADASLGGDGSHSDCVDNDHDGFYASANCGTMVDCDDNNNKIFPGAQEFCNYVDDNCNGMVDEGVGQGTFYADRDGDGYGDSAPGARTFNCNLPTPDPDNMGRTIPVVTVGGDCNDTNPAINPGATEICNLMDDNCDGMIDNGAAPISGAAEMCDGLDNNCDGLIDGWQITYNGSASLDDEGRAIALDTDGNVYVTGFATVLGESQNIWTRKMDSDGNVLWTDIYNGPLDGRDSGSGIAIDSGMNVYVAGEASLVSGQDEDIYVRKMDSEGVLVWDVSYDNPAHGCSGGPPCDHSDGAASIALLGDFLYVAGFTAVTGQSLNMWLNKYRTRDRGSAWTEPITVNTPSPGWSDDQALGVAVGPGENVYVTGFVNPYQSNDRDLWLNGYTSDRDPLWSSPSTSSAPPSSSREGHGIAVDMGGRIYVTGSTGTTRLREGTNIFIDRYNATNGSPVWSAPLDVTGSGTGSGGSIDGGMAIALDASGHIYVAGFETGLTGNADVWINKYDSNGSPLWSAPKTYDGGGDDQAFGIAVAPDGSIYVTGFTSVAGQGHNILVQKYLDCPSP